MRTKIILTGMALLLCVAAFVAYGLSQPHTVAAPTVATDRFDKDNYNFMPVDTLMQQLQQAYGDSMRITKEATELKVAWQPADGDLSGFYNNNEALKETGGKEFSIQTEGQSLRATFRIDKGVVQVPNEVLLGILKRVSGRGAAGNPV